MTDTLTKEELVDKLDTMLIRTIADIDEEYGESITGIDMKQDTRKAYTQIKEMADKFYSEDGQIPDADMEELVAYWKGIMLFLSEHGWIEPDDRAMAIEQILQQHTQASSRISKGDSPMLEFQENVYKKYEHKPEKGVRNNPDGFIPGIGETPQLEQTPDASMGKVIEFLDDLRAVVDESTGVDGWHLNGDVASWEEVSITVDRIDELKQFLQQHAQAPSRVFEPDKGCKWYRPGLPCQYQERCPNPEQMYKLEFQPHKPEQVVVDEIVVERYTKRFVYWQNDDPSNYEEDIDRFIEVARGLVRELLQSKPEAKVSREWVYYFCAYINAGHKSPADDENRVESAIKKFKEIGIKVGG